MSERGDQRLAFLRVRFAERDAILRAHERLRDRRRTRIEERPPLGVVRADGFKIRPQELGDRRGRAGRQNPRDPLAPFRRAFRLRARQIEPARPGMRVDETEWAFLAGQINQDAAQNGVLEHVCEIAGMKGVAIVDLNDLPVANVTRAHKARPGMQAAASKIKRTRSDSPPRSAERGLAQRTGATTIDVRWQVWRATFRQTA